MADVKWIKITTGIFDDEKILLIEALPEADTLIVIWFKLLCLAGKQNNQGVFMLNDTMPYTDKMLATIFRRSEATVKLALETFQQFGMVEIVDGVVTIPNWSKHQSLEAYDRKKEYDREFQRRKREQQKALIDKQSSDSRTTENDKSYDTRTTIVLPDKEEDKEEEDIYKSLSKDNDCPTESDKYSVLVSKWNELSSYGIKPIKAIKENTERIKYIRARIKQYGDDCFDEAIERIKHSDFLQGKHSGRPWQITFDWLILPNNFPKVIEGNYDNNEPTQQTLDDYGGYQ